MAVLYPCSICSPAPPFTCSVLAGCHVVPTSGSDILEILSAMGFLTLFLCCVMTLARTQFHLILVSPRSGHFSGHTAHAHGVNE